MYMGNQSSTGQNLLAEGKEKCWLWCKKMKKSLKKSEFLNFQKKNSFSYNLIYFMVI